MKYHAINPYFPLTVSLCLFAVSFFYPDSGWRTLVGEENLNFLNLQSLAFFLACVLLFVCGVAAVNHSGLRFSGSVVFYGESFSFERRPGILLLPVLLSVILVMTLYLLYLDYRVPGFVSYVFTGRGGEAKYLITSGELKFSTLQNVAVPVVAWAAYRYLDIKRKWGGSIPWVGAVLFLTVSIVIFVDVVTVARYALMPLFISLFVIFMKVSIFDNNKRSHLFVSLRFLLVLFLMIVSLFIVFSYLRGVKDVTGVFSMILGYGPVSFNRLAALLQGNLSFEYAGDFVYIVPEPFLTACRWLAGMAPVSGHDVWLSEFDSVAQSGLNGDFIWATTFGYIYDSIGYFSLVYFFFYGCLTAMFWKRFLSGRTSGIMFYCAIYFSIFFWFGFNYIVGFFVYYLLAYLLITVWEKTIDAICVGRQS